MDARTLPIAERRALFYRSQALRGGVVDWLTGAVTYPRRD